MIKFRWEKEFKETPVGKIPKDWEVRRLEDIAKISTGGTPSRKKKEYWNGNINWVKSQEVRAQFIWETEEKITIAGMRNSNAKRIYSPNTVLVALYGATAGEIAILKIPATINQAIAALEGTKVDDLFLFYSLEGNKKRLKESAIGSAQQNLYLRDIKQFTILLPPAKEEQQRIATVLSWFDDLIENKRRQNEVLEKVAMAIFKSWFIDFEPFQDEEFVYSEELDMEIPKGWEVKPIGEVAEVIKGISYKSSEISDERDNNHQKIFITLKCFKRGGGFRPEYKYYRSGNKAKLKKKNAFVVDGDLIIGITDMTPDAKVVGAPALVILPPSEKEGLISLDCAKLDVENVMKEYLYLFLKSTQEENSTFANGVNVLHLNTNLFKQSKFILVPLKPILERFHSLVEPLFRKIIINEKEIMVLKKARDTLLPQLVFGRLRVEEV